MSLFSLKNIRLAGVSACVPKQQVSNFTFDLISEKERYLLVKTTGIEKRRVAKSGTCTSDLCIESAKVLIDALNWKKEGIEVLIFITQTPDYITPATSSIIQDKLGLSRNCIVLDINLGCSAYVYGISLVGSLLNSTKGKRGLLLVGDVSTACISDRDKSATPLFSDAGSATALELQDNVAPMCFNLQGDGSGYDSIIIPEGGYRHPFNHESLKYEDQGEGIIRNKTHLILKGIDIYNFSVREVPPNVEKLIRFAGVSKEEVDYYVFHQANKLINEAIRKKLNLQLEQVPYSLKNFGNTSSATIPVTMITELSQQLEVEPLSMVFAGFGVGLSWSSMYLKTEHVVCPPLIEI